MCKLLFAAVALSFLWHETAAADEAADARAILDKAITAQGGEAALGKIVAMRGKTKGSYFDDGKPVAVREDDYYQGLDKMRSATYYDDAKTEEVDVLNGKEGWKKQDTDAAQAMTEAEMAAHRVEIYVSFIANLVPLKATEYQLSPVDEITIDGHKAVGLLVRHEKRDRVKLYFDKESYLLVKFETPVTDPDSGKSSIEEVTFSDFRTVSGTKQPFKMLLYMDGDKRVDLTVKSMELFDKPLDEKLFAKP